MSGDDNERSIPEMKPLYDAPVDPMDLLQCDSCQ